MNNAIFLKDGACAKLYDALLLLTDEYLSNPEAHVREKSVSYMDNFVGNTLCADTDNDRYCAWDA